MLDAILAYLGANQNALGFVILALAAATEYVFPPFPGDAVVLVGGVLVAAADWSAAFVFTAVTLGAVAGSMSVYRVGVWIADHPQSRVGRWLASPRLERGVERVLDGFRKHGAGYLAINRFLPGIRAFFFLAAGLGGLPARKVALWGTLSAALWNALIILGGVAVGGNLERLEGWFRTYTTAAWILLGTIALVWLARMLWARRRETG